MVRISTIFIAISMALVASSLGALTYFFLGIGKSAAVIVALAVFGLLLLYHAVSTRLHDRGDAGAQIADLSRGTADLARQVGEFGRRLASVETQMANADKTSAARIEAGLAPLSGELAELGSLVRQLAASMAHHETLIARAGPARSGIAQTGLAQTGLAQTGPAHGEPPAADRPPLAVVPSVFAAAAGPAATDPASLALMTIAIRSAVDANRIDLYLQPLITLPQRKVRFYEAVCRLRDDKGEVMTAANFIGPAESAGLMPRIDNAVLFRCVQVLRRLMVKNKDVGLFCNIATATLRDEIVFGQCLDFLDANRVLAPSLVLEFTLDALRNLSPLESEHLGMLVQRGFRVSVDHVTDLRLEPRELADRGVRFVKVPASVLLDQKRASTSDIHPADLSDLLGRFGIDLVAEKIESESAVVDLLDYDVRYGQGFLFSPPRLVRQETGPDAETAKPEPDPAASSETSDDGGNARIASGARAAIARGAAHRA